MVMRNKLVLNNVKENLYIIYYLCVYFICNIYYLYFEVNYFKSVIFKIYFWIFMNFKNKLFRKKIIN